MVDIQWLIGGEAGYGIMTSGVVMGKIFTRLGHSVFDYVEYPSLIRGGHNAYYVRASSSPIHSQKKTVDILVALNRHTVAKHANELSDHGVIIYDQDFKIDDIKLPPHVVAIPTPLVQITRDQGVDKLMMNTVAIASSLALFYHDFSVYETILNDAFGRKGGDVAAKNIAVAKAGFDFILKNHNDAFKEKVVKQEQKDVIIGGAEAVALGAIRAGLKFAAIYPMTPVNTVMNVLAMHALTYNIVVKEPEDEIAGINMTIGASFTGVRSMCATSGGGFSLMTEGLGLASQTEVPIVIIEGMRPGPATGMPTWTDQGDLRFVLHAHQGDFPRIILAPGDVFEAFSMTLHAFNLADKYQLPVIVLVDKYLMEGHATLESEKLRTESQNYKIERGKILTDDEAEKETDYKRYHLVEDGISPRSIPGQKGGIALTGSDEHDEKGLYNEEAEVRIAMMNKRYKKLEMATPEIPKVNTYGADDKTLTIIAFGSTKLPVLDAMEVLKKEGITIRFLQILSISPFPAVEVTNILNNSTKTFVIEGNYSGQLEGLIKEHTGLSINNHFRKYDGRPFYFEEIVEEVKKLI